MSDAVGAVTVPLVAPNDGEAVADVTLTHLGSFLKAFLERDLNATAAWQAARVAPGTPVVRSAFAHDPRKGDFNERDLPSLYLWREGSDKIVDYEGEDWLVEVGTVTVLWVMPPRAQAPQQHRAPILNGIAKSLLVALHRGRTPGYVVSGDPDPRAATQGSLVWDTPAMRLFRFPIARKWQPFDLVIPMSDGEPRTYAALQVTVELTEAQELDLTRYDAIDGVDQKLLTEDGTRVLQEEIYD